MKEKFDQEELWLKHIRFTVTGKNPPTWSDYLTKAKESISQKIEKHFDIWTSTDKPFSLISTLMFTENNFEESLSGKVTNRFDFCVGGNSVKELEDLFYSSYFKKLFDTTMQHFIVDNKNKRVVRILSVCA